MAKEARKSGARRSDSFQARGQVRREKLAVAASELLNERPLDEISIAAIAERAGIPVGSAYHFYPDLNSVFAILTVRFFEELATVLGVPIAPEHAATWQNVIETVADRAACLYDRRPDCRQLILGGKAPAAIKLADRANDERVGQMVIDAIEQHFVLPEFPRRAEVFFYAVEIADLFFTLSQIRHGKITKELCSEAKNAAISYLRAYLPEHLPRRIDQVASGARGPEA